MACSLCGQQPELCVSCSSEDVALIRESSLALEEFNQLSRKTIDDIFNRINVLQSGGVSDPIEISNTTLTPQLTSTYNKQNTEKSTNDPKHLQVPQISEAAIKLLLQQLLRLEVVNQKLKNYQASKTYEALEKRMNKTKNNIYMLSEKIKVEEEKLTKLNTSIQDKGETKAKNLKELQSYEIIKLSRVCRQARKLQLLTYHILIEAYFSTHGRYVLKKLYFNRQPIINIEQFLGYNGRLEHLNLFLENLIFYQIKLAQIFEGSLIKMPYLEELTRLLPDLKFFEVVRNKEIEMFGDYHDNNIEEEVVMEENMVHSDGQIINLGDALKLPLSLKTLNYQRREETRRKSIVDSSSENESKSPIKAKSKSGHIGKLLVQNLNNKALPEMQNILKKKVVILPHKILTKPLTKLSSKELVKFLQIIVKILINFKVFFASTISLTELYDLSKILEHSANLAPYLELIIDMPLSVANVEGGLDHQMDSEPQIMSPNLSSKPSVLNFYSRLLNFSSEGSNSDRRKTRRSGINEGIFGDVSEMGESYQHDYGDKDRNRVSMKKVYDLMVRDSNQHREKIEDWLVISKLI